MSIFVPIDDGFPRESRRQVDFIAANLRGTDQSEMFFVIRS